jgi:RHS repeat-associated protein
MVSVSGVFADPPPPYYGPAVLATSSLRAYWPLDETSGTTAHDQASSPANGTYAGGVTLGQSGAITTSSDNAVAFNGSSGYVWTGIASKLQPSASLTLEAWFKTTATGTRPIVQSGQWPGAGGAALYLSNGKLASSIDFYTVTSANSYNDGAWHYAVVTWDGSKETLYVDGALAAPASGNNPNPLATTHAPVYGSYGVLVGKDTYGPADYFNGSIDEVALYGSNSDSSGALSAGQVANHYAAATSGPVTTPVDVTAPTVSGRPLVGSTYTLTSNGSWNSSTEIYGALSYTYQWYRCGYDGSACTAIGGATGLSHTVTSSDNAHALRVQVTASNSSASASVSVNLPAIGGYRSAVFTDGGSNLRGYWPLDDTYSYPNNQAAVDASDSPANGTFLSGVTLNAAGAINDGSDSAATFDGSSGYVATAAPSKLQPSASLTLEAWFKTTASGTRPIVQSGQWPGAGGAALYLSSGKVGCSVDFVSVTSASTYNDGAWHYAVVTWDGSKETLYVDGALAAPASGSNPNPVATTHAPVYGSYGVYVGKDTYGPADYFNGSIDEPALYGSNSDSSGALSAGQVANQYATATSGPVATPVDVTAPTVSGRPLVGATLSATPGSWSSSTQIYGALSYSYQWYRCGYDGATCSAIGGATGSSYTVTSSDNAHTLGVRVTASNSSASASATVNLPAIGGYRSAVFSDGGSNLRGYWPLDESYPYSVGQPVADISDSPANATYLTGVTVAQPGAISDGSDLAATFNGSSGYLTTAVVSKLQPSASLTLEAWFKTTATGTQPILQSGAWRGAGGAALYLSNGKLASSIDFYTVTSANSYNDGAWHYAVVTWDGSKETLYVDGALATAASGTNPNPLATTHAPVYGGWGVLIGRDTYGPFVYFNGSIDEPALYGSNTDSSGALSATQIANHYALGIYEKAPTGWTVGNSNDAVPGLCNCAQSAGDPVNTANGDFSETLTDVSVRSYGPTVAFSRTYDASLAQSQARAGTPGILGYGWTDNWGMSLSVSSGVVTVTQGNGAQVTFYPPPGGACQSPYVGSGASGTYCALPDVTASLSYDSGSSTYTFVTHPYQKYVFNGSGQLTGEAGPGGSALAVSYNTPSPGSGNCPSTATSCTTIASASGRALVIAKSSSGLVTKVVDPLGRTWTYAYCSPPSSTCSTGDLVSVTDPLGRVTSFTYDQGNANAALKHDLLTVTKPNGQTGGPNAGAKLVNVYDSSGRVSSQTDPSGNHTTFDYTHLDPTTGSGYAVVTDPDGNETKSTYSQGILTAQVSGYSSSSPATTGFGPDSATLLDTSVTDPNGNTSSYGYNANGIVTSSTDPLGQTATYSYNGFDEQTCAATAQAASPCSSLSPPAAITAGSSTISPPSSVPPKYVTYSEYDTDGNLIWTTAGDYNPGSSSASQQRTTYDLYNGESVTIGTTVDSCAASAPSSSLPCATIDPNGVVTQLGYDTAGDVASSATPDGNSGGEVSETTYGYNGDGERTSTTAPDGNLTGATAGDFTTTTVYDNAGQVSSVTVGQTGGSVTPRTTGYGYDPNGNRTAVTNARGKTTTYTFNADDELTLSTDPDGNATLTCYDGDGNVAQTVPAVGVAANSLTPASCPTAYPAGYGSRLADDATASTYNALNQKTTVTTPAPAGQSGSETTTYVYDVAGQLTSVTAPPASDAGGAPNQVTVYSYDDAGQLLTVTTASGTSDAATTSYCYDPDGNKTATVSPDGNTSGVAACAGSSPYETSSPYQTGYSYDSLGELVSKARPATASASSGQTTGYSYDPAGNVLTSTDPNGVTTTDTYTPLNQVATTSYSDSSTPAVDYAHDANGNRVTMDDGTGTSTYVYDPFNELTSYENGAGKTVTYSYSDDGQTTGITYPLGSGAGWAAGDTVGYGYDNADQLSSITDFNGNTIAVGNTADGLPNSLSLGSTGDTITTTYDATDAPSQIALANSSSTLLQFAYSDVPSGAIASETDTPSWSGSPASYSYDAQSRVTQMTPGMGSALTYGFDASGNPTTLPTGAAGSYDNASELTSATLTGTTTSYSYDAAGQRTQATRGGTTVMAASYNGAGELASYSNAAANLSSTTYDGDGTRQDATITPTGGTAVTEHFTWDTISAVPRLLMDSDNAYIYGTATAPTEQVNLATGTIHYLLADSLGSVRGVIGSTGVLTASTGYDAWGNPQTTGGLSNATPFGFAGGYTDPTGLSYLVHRYYDPQTGQLLTVDPLIDETGAPYAYTSDDPVNSTDPSGTCGQKNPAAQRSLLSAYTKRLVTSIDSTFNGPLFLQGPNGAEELGSFKAYVSLHVRQPGLHEGPQVTANIRAGLGEPPATITSIASECIVGQCEEAFSAGPGALGLGRPAVLTNRFAHGFAGKFTIAYLFTLELWQGPNEGGAAIFAETVSGRCSGGSSGVNCGLTRIGE